MWFIFSHHKKRTLTKIKRRYKDQGNRREIKEKGRVFEEPLQWKKGYVPSLLGEEIW